MMVFSSGNPRQKVMVYGENMWKRGMTELESNSSIHQTNALFVNLHMNG